MRFLSKTHYKNPHTTHTTQTPYDTKLECYENMKKIFKNPHLFGATRIPTPLTRLKTRLKAILKQVRECNTHTRIHIEKNLQSKEIKRV